MAIKKIADEKYSVRWRENGRHRNRIVNGPKALAKKIERSVLSKRDENRYIDVRKEVNYRMTDLIERYEQRYALRKKSYSREKSILAGIRAGFGRLFVSEVDGIAVDRWYQKLLDRHTPGTARRHFNVMHHMMRKAATIWASETGIDRNPADQVEQQAFDDARLRYLSPEEMKRLKSALDAKLYRKRSSDTNRTFYRLRLIVLIALSTGMREGEIFRLRWSDIRYEEGLISVDFKLKRGKQRVVPLTPELAAELRRYPRCLSDDHIFPPAPGARSGRQRVDKSFATLLKTAKIEGFRFNDLRHTFASWYMMHGGDLYELAKILGHANITVTERYAKLSQQHIATTGDTAREIWTLMDAPVQAEAAS